MISMNNYDIKNFYCTHKKRYFDKSKYTEVKVYEDSVCLEANSSDLHLWNDGTYHWVSEEENAKRVAEWKAAQDEQNRVKEELQQALAAL